MFDSSAYYKPYTRPQVGSSGMTASACFANRGLYNIQYNIIILLSCSTKKKKKWRVKNLRERASGSVLHLNIVYFVIIVITITVVVVRHARERYSLDRTCVHYIIIHIYIV